MNFVCLAVLAQTAPQDLRSRPDWGFVAVVAGLVFAAVQAHRYWRRTIRLEDQLEALKRDQAFTFEKYRAAFKALQAPAALVERGSGLVTEATPGWVAAGLPAVGSRLGSGEVALLPAPDAAGTVAPPATLTVGGRAHEAVALTGAGLGLVLVQPQ